jgi:hypothetical protein
MYAQPGVIAPDANDAGTVATVSVDACMHNNIPSPSPNGNTNTRTFLSAACADDSALCALLQAQS